MAIKKSRLKKWKKQEGQAVTEYIMLVGIIAFGYTLLTNAISQWGLAQKISDLLTGNFSAAYRYGKTTAKGYEDGGPINHPRAETPGNGNFRIFFNSNGSGGGDDD
jgi:hypothetical protein